MSMRRRRRPVPVPQDPVDRCDEHFPRTPRGLHRAAVASGAMWYTAPSLLFMLFVVIPAFDERSLLRGAAIIVLALAYSVLFLYLPGIKAYGRRLVYAYVALGWLVIGLLALVIGSNVLYMVMFVLIMHTIALPWHVARVVVGPIALVTCVLAVVLDQPTAIILAVVGVMIALGVGYGIQQEVLSERLARAEQRNAVLAVAAERERIGRDLHDILGHSLTTITVSAQLARRLVDADPEAARAQLAEIERISRQSLADVRATASGMQQVRAATEIASARSVLAAAGIEADTPASLPPLPDDRAELLGYVIREGVTNVVRHSRATRCTIRLDTCSASVADDGVGIPAARPRTGLAGLERRVEDAGGRLTVRSAAGAGTLVRAELDAADGEAGAAGVEDAGGAAGAGDSGSGAHAADAGGAEIAGQPENTVGAEGAGVADRGDGALSAGRPPSVHGATGTESAIEHRVQDEGARP
ncbi:sensor histidine kinase [Brachybacterium huguangmaarense]|uniref:Sensor histidine kinase n=1 Tax=Brachybacterium huguangmaarense TaxID=1652028 RepID=A0ABY6G577_9MICO|nr:sensor histidine kinase [Brachybacterium huguangmaarense]UYG17833.1 sensor histidine kinase [Brachybacterium huguangmaarense]